MIETLEHTADIGIRIRADDLATLFAEAARGMFSLVVGNLADVEPDQEVHVRIDGEDPVYLLFDWLSELLFAFDTQHIVFSEFSIRMGPPATGGLTATARGQRLDERTHKLDHEIKAVTYHGLKLDRSDDGWLAEILFDV